MDDNSIKNQLQNVKAISKRMSRFCGLVLIICIILAIYLFIDDSRSVSDGGLGGAIAAFALIPVATIMIIMLKKQSRKRMEVDKLLNVACVQKDTMPASDKTKSGDANSTEIISFLKNEKRAGIIWKIICSIVGSLFIILMIAGPLRGEIMVQRTNTIIFLIFVIVIFYVVSFYCVFSVYKDAKHFFKEKPRRLVLITVIVAYYFILFMFIILGLSLLPVIISNSKF